MTLVDSSVWIEHTRRADVRLQDMLGAKQVFTHPFVIGELALGHLRPRKEMLLLLHNLPQVILATDNEVLDFIECHSLHGIGIGYVDAHLLVSVKLGGIRLWTRDKRLHDIAIQMNLALTSH